MLQSYILTCEHWSSDPNDLDFTSVPVIEELSTLAQSERDAMDTIAKLFPKLHILKCELDVFGRKKMEVNPHPRPVPTKVPSPMRPADAKATIVVVGGVGNVSKPLVIKAPEMVATKKWWKL
jgi:hypothetical protein